MSNKKTLADLMNNDFFIDFDDNTKAKAERKSLAESLTCKPLKESKDNIDNSALNRCYKRVCKAATRSKSFTWDNNDYIPVIAIKVSKEHLKKALKLGNFERNGRKCRTIPAQYVESVCLEYFDNFIDAEFRDEDEDCLLSVLLQGTHEKTGHDLDDFVDFGGDGTVYSKEIPAFKTPEESMNFFNNEVVPNATKIAEEIIDKAWAESGYTDYEGITDDGHRSFLKMQGYDLPLEEGFYKDTYDMTKDKISEEDLYKALVTDGELVSLNAGNTGEAVSFKDGGVYCDTTYEITEYDGKFSIAEFYNSDDGDWKEGDYYFETDSFETLCAELQKIFPNALIECKMTEEVEEPDNAVVDCKVNKVIAHSEDEKPVDCLGKKKPLEKPLTEEPNKMTADELKDKYGTDNVDLINAGKEPEERVELK